MRVWVCPSSPSHDDLIRVDSMVQLDHAIIEIHIHCYLATDTGNTGDQLYIATDTQNTSDQLYITTDTCKTSVQL